MRVALTVVVLLLAALPSLAKGGFEEALATLRAAETYDSDSVGFAGVKSSTWKAYTVFREKAPRTVVVSMLADESSVVRCYALRALVEKHKGVDLLPLLLVQADDPREVVTYRGCSQAKELAPDVMLRVAEKRLSDEQREKFGARLAAGKKKLAIRKESEREWQREIKELAKEGDAEALLGRLELKGVPESRRRTLGQVARQTISPYRCAALRPVFWTLWIDFGAIDAEILADLAAADRSRARAQAARHLEKRGVDNDTRLLLSDYLKR